MFEDLRGAYDEQTARPVSFDQPNRFMSTGRRLPQSHRRITSRTAGGALKNFLAAFPHQFAGGRTQ